MSLRLEKTSIAKEMTWCNSSSVGEGGIDLITKTSKEGAKNSNSIRSTTCSSCGHNMEFQDQSEIVMHDLPGLPAGVKFDPSDQEILEHLEAKAVSDSSKKLHPLIDEFIPTLEGENGICYTHPEKLPGVSNDGQLRHFFHRPSRAYTTGTRKRRKVHTDHEDGSETRWHKTGKTRPVLSGGTVKGFKKILVLYTNYGRQRKPEKTNWVMHQYHLGDNEEEKDGELVASKVFYQTQPRQCGGSTSSIVIKDNDLVHHHNHHQTSKSRTGVHDHIHINPIAKNTGYADYYNPSFVGNYDHNRESPPQLIPNFVVQGDGSSSFIRLAADASNKAKINRR